MRCKTHVIGLPGRALLLTLLLSGRCLAAVFTINAASVVQLNMGSDSELTVTDTGSIITAAGDAVQGADRNTVLIEGLIQGATDGLDFSGNNNQVVISRGASVTAADQGIEAEDGNRIEISGTVGSGTTQDGLSVDDDNTLIIHSGGQVLGTNHGLLADNNANITVASGATVLGSNQAIEAGDNAVLSIYGAVAGSTQGIVVDDDASIFIDSNASVVGATDALFADRRASITIAGQVGDRTSEDGLEAGQDAQITLLRQAFVQGRNRALVLGNDATLRMAEDARLDGENIGAQLGRNATVVIAGQVGSSDTKQGLVTGDNSAITIEASGLLYGSDQSLVADDDTLLLISGTVGSARSTQAVLVDNRADIRLFSGASIEGSSHGLFAGDQAHISVETGVQILGTTAIEVGDQAVLEIYGSLGSDSGSYAVLAQDEANIKVYEGAILQGQEAAIFADDDARVDIAGELGSSRTQVGLQLDNRAYVRVLDQGSIQGEDDGIEVGADSYVWISEKAQVSGDRNGLVIESGEVLLEGTLSGRDGIEIRGDTTTRIQIGEQGRLLSQTEAIRVREAADVTVTHRGKIVTQSNKTAIELDRGNDTLVVEQATIVGGKRSIDMGGGDDKVYLRGYVEGSIDGGEGYDEIDYFGLGLAGRRIRNFEKVSAKTFEGLAPDGLKEFGEALDDLDGTPQDETIEAFLELAQLGDAEIVSHMEILSGRVHQQASRQTATQQAMQIQGLVRQQSHPTAAAAMGSANRQQIASSPSGQASQFQIMASLDTERAMARQALGLPASHEPLQHKQRTKAYIASSGSISKQGTTQDYARARYVSANIILGIDHSLNTALSMGAYAGFHHTFSEIGSTDSTVEDSGVTLGFYANWSLSENWWLFTHVGYLYHSYLQQRAIALPHASFTATSEPVAHQLSTSVYLHWNHRFGQDQRWQLTPYIGLQQSYLHSDGYQESGAGVLNLQAFDQNALSLRSDLGFELQRRFHYRDTTLIPRLKLAWRREYLIGGSQEFALQDNAFDSFDIEGRHAGRQSLLLGSGLTVAFDRTGNTSAFLDYQLEISEDHYLAQSLQGGFEISY